MFDLNGKVALVTGAQRGIGKAHALALSAQGASVVATDAAPGSCDAVAAEIERSGGSALSLALDVTSKSSIDAAFDRAIDRFGKIDILINNAGIFEPKPALELTEDDWDRTMTVNLRGQFLCAQRAAKEMQKGSWGRIINIASIASGGVGVGIAGAAHYTASKGGIIGMSETLAVEFAPFGITVNVIAPGGINTPMANPSGKPAEELTSFMSRVPLKRIGNPEEVAAATVFLASIEASYVTGATLYVDGGWLAA